MEDKRQRVQSILVKKEWSIDDRNFILKTLEEDRNLVQEISREFFSDSIENSQDLLTRIESDRILNDINKEIGKVGQKEKVFGIRNLTVAASLLLLVTLGFFTRKYWSPLLLSERTLSVSTQLGEIKNLELADGSSVWLNGGSKLVYPEKFRGGTRLVSLEGEAFFEVKSNVSKPFVIESGDITTTVVGTAFNVRSYKEDSISAVAVASGIVKVGLNGNEGNQIKINPDEEVVYNKNMGTLFMSNGYSQSQINWKDREFKYSAIPLGLVLKDLQRSFNVEIIPGENIKNCKIFADFRGDELNDMLEVLKSLVNAKILQKENGSYRMIGLDEGC
ncbi:FecR family protein [Membranihabitans maritimus]|uniref:FecR family protein n=1 Tax=Membranihabitans maritimus TaxID=2904244 RepID=UPI001F2F9FBA